jgi:peptidoglycan/xylan/chitin deacetylase (PgdA/CDA1 family)
MTRVFRLLAGILLLALCCCGSAAAAADQAAPPISVPILLYHRFAPTVVDSMTTTIKVFAWQLKWLKDHDYHVIRLRSLINYLRGDGPPPPPHSVVIVADDGHKSVYNYMFPLIRRYKYPVTLFIYPSCISNAHYAMTWQQLKKLQQTGLFDLQGHTYWHPNFKKDKKKMTPAQFQKDLHRQLVISKKVLEKHFGTKVDLLAWPFGIYDKELEDAASKAGYTAAFSIDRYNVAKGENLMTLPRYLMSNGDQGKRFVAIVTGHDQERRHRTY